MTYQTELEFHPLYELVSSMGVFMNHKAHFDLDKQWYQSIEAKVSASFKQNMKNEERLNELGYIFLLIWKCPKKESLSDFLQWFQSFSVGEMYELLIPYFGDCPIKDIGAFRAHYSDLLESWNEVYTIEESMIAELKEWTSFLKEESKTLDPVEFVENCTNGIRIYPMENLRKLILVPSYHIAPMNSVYDYDTDIMFVQFAVDQPSNSPTVPSQSFVRKTKALADSKRLRILQFLAIEPKTFTEIVKETKLSKSNLHYHLTLLRTAGLVRITNYAFKEPDKYETRPLGFTALKEDIEQYIFENREKF
jgi:DNA-binding transcriptional ArsR family regulator